MIFSNLLLSFCNFLLDLLPAFHVARVSLSNVNTLSAVFGNARYFLPMDTVYLIFSIGVKITMFRILLAILLRVKSFIPTMGD